MPTLNKQFELTITPEQFLRACSIQELIEVDLLIQSPRFRDKITADQRQLKIEVPKPKSK